VIRLTTTRMTKEDRRILGGSLEHVFVVCDKCGAKHGKGRWGGTESDINYATAAARGDGWEHYRKGRVTAIQCAECRAKESS